MAMDLGGAKGGVKSDINVTPLVDVMLVLLIIMMLVAPLLQQGVHVKLPIGEQHRRQARRRRTRRSSRSRKDKADVPEREAHPATTSWRRRSTERFENKKEKVVLIKADEEVDYGAVMAAMDYFTQGINTQ